MFKSCRLRGGVDFLMGGVTSRVVIFLRLELLIKNWVIFYIFVLSCINKLNDSISRRLSFLVAR